MRKRIGQTAAALSPAQRCALECLAGCSRWVPVGRVTMSGVSFSVHGATVRRLEKMGLAKSRCELISTGHAVSGADLVRYLGEWREVWTITPAGMRAIDWEGECF